MPCGGLARFPHEACSGAHLLLTVADELISNYGNTWITNVTDSREIPKTVDHTKVELYIVLRMKRTANYQDCVDHIFDKREDDRFQQQNKIIIKAMLLRSY
ncbi:hypothetical protein EVAR_14199_1 [Eumeta japonica]|uniref:Uncharacterized protein n=1 Tax=Eumeta variegata TaxID=151549 RepID=A0A4C1UFY0_EUMVA|nr:hypothetical protein EVAR_14199_1 [Eumeta japonica]